MPDDLHARFFRWKHRENPFGPSACWIALDGGRVVGFRAFLRWEFERDGEPVRAVRTVDAATHPEYQRRGIFTRLTTAGLDELQREGVAFVFNTPNPLSLQGNFKLGWQELGRLPLRIRLRSPLALARVARARVPAGKWSVPTEVGAPLGEVLAPQLVELVEDLERDGLATRRTARYLAWRYGFAELAYRCLPLEERRGPGVVVFRLRRRGPALEAAVCEVLSPRGPRQPDAGVLRQVVRRTGADYAVTLGAQPGGGRGPLLTWRPVSGPSRPPDEWRLSLADVELF